MATVLAKLSLEDPFGNKFTLLVKANEDEIIHYSLSGAVSRIAMSLTNMQIRKPLPDLMLDFDNVKAMIKEVVSVVNTGTDNVIGTKIYSK